ncbi:universal stress protein [Nocardia sp. NEAU-G5]|uniref:Universal stress protein n=1 Tax=Nocardia albiluteola TaxID=2842303 RepID=A0ABS6AZF5_9NOCA|nr:universal stress protein [Nocardia albiluteola]MBU3062384.1 universal stress protein [Nocardia albiluteola]
MSTHHSDDVRHLASAPIVVGVDGSAAADAAVAWAAETAERRGRTLCIVHGMNLAGMTRTLEPYDLLEPPVLEAVRARAGALVERAAQRALAAAPGVRVQTEVSAADAVRLLLRYGSTAYLMVLGASGAGGLAAHLGSTVLSVSCRAEGVVVVVRPHSDPGRRVRREGPVVVGVDGGPVSEAAIGAAFEEATERCAELVAVHVWDDAKFGHYAGNPYLVFPTPEIEVTEQALLAERLAGWQEKYPDVLVNRRVYPSDPVRTLLAWSGSAQLVVVGSRGHGWIRGALLGSTSNALVQHANCPVMVVHPDERSES